MTENRLILQDVSVERGKSRILHGISATFSNHRMVGLIGPNGAGKSTLLNAIAGMIKHEGVILWGDKPPKPGEIGFLPQDCKVSADLTVTETMLLGQHQALGLKISNRLLDQALHLIEEIGLLHLKDRSMQSLSGGQAQMVLLAQRLMRRPKLVLLDEATSALDLHHQMQALGLMRRYIDAENALVLIAIHDLNLAARYCDEVMLLCGGKRVDHDHFNQVVTKDSLKTTYRIEAEFLNSSTGQACILPLRPSE